VKNNQIIIEGRDAGKTTYLLTEIDRLHREGVNIVVMDSATEHGEKSLLKKTCNSINKSIVIDMHDSNSIVIDKVGINHFVENFVNYFPFAEVVKNRNKTICFDLSYFLEKGHDEYDKTNSIELYNYYRGLYNNLSQQIVVSLILMEKHNIINNTVVVMDEIEFPIVNYDVSLLQKDLSFIASVHPENAFGTFYTTFDKLKFISYRRRKK
jgi:hypothetical protein